MSVEIRTRDIPSPTIKARSVSGYNAANQNASGGYSWGIWPVFSAPFQRPIMFLMFGRKHGDSRDSLVPENKIPALPTPAGCVRREWLPA